MGASPLPSGAVKGADVVEPAEPEDVTFPDTESTAPSSHIEPDFSTDDEGYADSTTTSYVTSLASDIRRGVEENGRTYAAYGIHKPWVPVDDREVSFRIRLVQLPVRHEQA